MITLHCSRCPATTEVVRLPAQLPEGWSGTPHSRITCDRCTKVNGRPHGPMVNATSVPEMSDALRAAISHDDMPAGYGVEELLDMLAEPVLAAMTERADRARKLAVRKTRHDIATRLNLI